LNYRHHFHAGNFADILKHGLLLHLLARLMAGAGPLSVIDTHAGAGAYDLGDDKARRSGEAAAGIGRLVAAPDLPDALVPLRRAVERENGDGEVRLYPGSPLLVARRLRPGDRYTGYELRADDHAELAKRLRPWPGAVARREDGYAALSAWRAEAPRLALVDPPFERGDDYANAAAAVGEALATDPATVAAIWTPLKDLETFDAFLGRLEALPGVTGLVVQARLKPLDDPLRMNGCALAILAPPSLLDVLAGPAGEIAGWIVAALGGPGGEARVERL
jgi:23S rRNA (adenine2030-N6)-methyltransferase